MIGAAMHAMNAAVAEFDESMGAIVCGREVPRLKNYAALEALEAFEEQEPFQAPGSSRLIFVHEQNALRRLVDQDPVEDLPNVVVVADKVELAAVPVAGGTAGAGGGADGGAGGAAGSGDTGCPGGAVSSGGADGYDGMGS